MSLIAVAVTQCERVTYHRNRLVHLVACGGEWQYFMQRPDEPHPPIFGASSYRKVGPSRYAVIE